MKKLIFVQKLVQIPQFWECWRVQRSAVTQMSKDPWKIGKCAGSLLFVFHVSDSINVNLEEPFSIP